MEKIKNFKLDAPPKNVTIPASVWSSLQKIEVTARKQADGSVLVNTRYLIRILRNAKQVWFRGAANFLQKNPGANLLF